MYTDFADLLKVTMGLDAASIGEPAIERAVRQRLAACGFTDLAAYYDRVRASADELQELIEAVVVPETWFFRDPEAFAALARMALGDWQQTHPTGVLRVLSLPSSTGEEPYSMAMALLDAGMPATRFRIDSIDISTRSLAFARRAVFGRNSFRGDGLDFRERHFESEGTHWRLSERVRQQVEFRQGNVLAASLPADADAYDAVFCRNLLIYFDRVTQDRVVAALTKLLTPRGWLFVGPSETGLILSHAFVSAKIPLAFAFRQAGATTPEPAAVAAHSPQPRPLSRVMAPLRPLPFSSVSRRTPAPAAVAPAGKPKSGIDHALGLADQGHLVEAAKICEAHLHAHGPSAQAFYIMGLVRDASGRHTDAAAYYRKALYLEPQHQAAMEHLALLLSAQGDRAGAKLLHDRARRLEQRVAK